MLLVTPRTKRASIARAAGSGTPLPVRLARTLSSGDLLRIFEDHENEDYGEELAELLLAAPRANSALVERALERYPSSVAILNAAALSDDTSKMRLMRLARSPHRSVRQHARLSLLSDSLFQAPVQTFMEAVRRAKRSRDYSEQLYIIATHRHVPRSVLRELAHSGPDLVKEEASRRLSRTRRRARSRP
jgi:hypothetical protein